MAAAVSHHLKDVAFGIECGRGLGNIRPLASITQSEVHIWMGARPRRLGSMLQRRRWGCSWGGNKQDQQMLLPEHMISLLSSVRRDTLGSRLQSKSCIEASLSPATPRGVVVTGASKGLGFALAQEFLKQGDNLVICSRSQEGVDRALASLRGLENAAGGRVHGLECNVGSAEDVEKLSAFARERLGTVHIWLNNAGQVTSKRLLADVPIDEIQSAVSCNVLGSLFGSRAAVQLMREQPGAREGPPQYHILNFGFTDFGVKNTKSATTHKATKSSLMWLTRALLDELKEAGLLGIGVHNCSPGMVLTDLLLKDSTPSARRFFNALAEEPETVAAGLVPQIRELSSRDASVDYVTPVGAVRKILTGLPQIVQGGRFFDKEGNRVRQPGAEYAENGVRVQVSEEVTARELQEERTQAR